MVPAIASGPYGLAGHLARLDDDADGAAWAGVQAAVGAAMLETATRIGGRELAEDAVQEALLRLRRSAAGFRRTGIIDDAQALLWCRRVAANTARNLRERSHCRERHEQRSAAGIITSSHVDPFEQHERLAVLRGLIAQLPEPERRAVEQRVLAGHSTEAVAARGARSADTVRWRVRRAVAMLRAGMRRAGYLIIFMTISAPRRALAATTTTTTAAAKTGGLTSALISKLLLAFALATAVVATGVWRVGSPVTVPTDGGSPVMAPPSIGSRDATPGSATMDHVRGNDGIFSILPDGKTTHGSGYVSHCDGAHLTIQNFASSTKMANGGMRRGTVDLPDIVDIVTSDLGETRKPGSLADLKPDVFVRVVIMASQSGRRAHITIFPQFGR